MHFQTAAFGFFIFYFFDVAFPNHLIYVDSNRNTSQNLSVFIDLNEALQTITIENINQIMFIGTTLILKTKILISNVSIIFESLSTTKENEDHFQIKLSENSLFAMQNNCKVNFANLTFFGDHLFSDNLFKIIENSTIGFQVCSSSIYLF